jgi:hypothetical protein
MRNKSKIHALRDISELRIQYFCEYRYFLKSKYGNSSSIACVRGKLLHSRIGDDVSASTINLLPLGIIIAVVILFLLTLYINW